MFRSFDILLVFYKIRYLTNYSKDQNIVVIFNLDTIEEIVKKKKKHFHDCLAIISLRTV